MIIELELREMLAYMKPFSANEFVPVDDVVLMLQRSNHDGAIDLITLKNDGFLVRSCGVNVDFCYPEEVPVRVMVDAASRRTAHIEKVALALQS